MAREILGGHSQKDRMKPPRHPPVQYEFRVNLTDQLMEVQIDPDRLRTFTTDTIIYPKNGSFGVVKRDFNAYRLDPPRVHKHDIRGLTGWKALQDVILYNGLYKNPFWTLRIGEEFGAHVKKPPDPRRSHRHHK